MSTNVRLPSKNITAFFVSGGLVGVSEHFFLGFQNYCVGRPPRVILGINPIWVGVWAMSKYPILLAGQKDWRYENFSDYPCV